MVGLTLSLLLSVIALVRADTQACTNRELIDGSATAQPYQTGESSIDMFTITTNSDGSTTFKRTESPSGIESQQENCGVLLVDNKPAEIVMSFKIINQAGSQRYCMKAITNGYALFYVMGQITSSATGFTVEECISQTGDATAYKMMVKLPLPTPLIPRPDFQVDISSIMKPGSYRLTYSIGTGSQTCGGLPVTQSSVVISSDSVTFYPCGSTATSFKNPLRKELFVVGFVTDELLDVVRNPNQMNSAFVVLAYTDNLLLKYYLMRVSTSAFSDPALETYLEVFGLTSLSTAYSQIGYSDIKYISPGLIGDLMTFRAYSDECLKAPCLNGGTCQDKWLNYTCTCARGFEGDNCEIRKDECAKKDVGGSLCSYKGICMDTIDGYTCNCNDGYVGATCQSTTTCLSDTCKNGGTCFDPKSGNVAICDCPPEWRGETCDEKYVCAAYKPCRNGGTCYDDLDDGHYRCQCPPGFHGQHCDNDAGTSPGPGAIICEVGGEEVCLNGGQCIDSKCECDGYFVGIYCQDLSRWFVASIVLIVLLAVVFIVTIVVCCCFCMRGRSARAYNQEKKPYDPFDRSTYPAMAEGFGVVGPAATGSIPGYGYPGTNQTYAPSGFTITQQAPTNDSPLFLSNF